MVPSAKNIKKCLNTSYFILQKSDKNEYSSFTCHNSKNKTKNNEVRSLIWVPFYHELYMNEYLKNTYLDKLKVLIHHTQLKIWIIRNFRSIIMNKILFYIRKITIAEIISKSTSRQSAINIARETNREKNICEET